MKDIDFLPARYRERGAHRRSQYWRIVVLVTFGGLICAAVIGQYGIRRNVEQQADIARAQHAAAMNEANRLARLELETKPLRLQAELLTFLRHPWPVTRIVSQVLAPLPDSITLTKLQVDREQVASAAAGVPIVSEASQPAAAVATIPAERDLQRFRQEADQSQVVVTLEGTAEDEVSLHVYLGQLAAAGLFAKAELSSIESEVSDAGNVARFRARLVVRAGYGQQGGPTTSPASTPTPSAAPQRVAGRSSP